MKSLNYSMLKKFSTLIILNALPVLLLFSACKQKSNEPEQKTPPVEEMSATSSGLENFDLTQLVSLTDTICGMSLEDGVADTLLVGTSIYGFCSEGCKVKFKSMLAEK